MSGPTRRPSCARRLATAGAVLVLAGAAPVGGGPAAPARADASCILAVTYHGAWFAGSQGLPPADVRATAGTATLPPCIDTVPAPPVTPPATVLTAYRVRDVAPRYAVAVRFAGEKATLVVADGTPCPPVAAVARRLACLRRMTRALRSGPALVAPLAADQGAIIPVTVHVADPARRRSVSVGIDVLLQRRAGSRWRTAYHLVSGLRTGRVPDPVPAGDPALAVPAIALLGGATLHVRIPETAAGTYRLALGVYGAPHTHWLTTAVAVRDVPGPCSYCTPG